jgi:outer membrane protein OmpA-like peptidoglycan-associated protein
MSLIHLRKLTLFGALFETLLFAALISACVATAPQVERPPELADDSILEQGIQYAVDDLLAQALKMPGFQVQPKSGIDQLFKAEKPKKVVVIIDNTIEGTVGQQTAATRFVDQRLLQLMRARLENHEVSSITEENVKSANFVVTGTLTQIQQEKGRGRFRLNASISDLRSGFVIAQAVARVKPTGVDETPTKFFRDSPAMSKDRVVEGQIKTADTHPGAEADGLYLARLPIGALVAEGDKHYESGRCEDALKYFDAAAARPEGLQLRVLNAIYLCHLQLGHQDVAEAAFGRIVALGLATNNLSVKFLFRPGSTEFISDPKVNASYTMWLRQIAKETSAAKVCMLVTGHTSKTGPEHVNERLSLQRATVIQRRLEAGAVDTVGRLQSIGMGSRENLIGSGSDDLRDALDRRVEFKVRPC